MEGPEAVGKRSRLHWFANNPDKVTGQDLPRMQWSTLDHLRTSIGCFRADMKKWNPRDSSSYECGNPVQRVDHIVAACPHHPPPNDTRAWSPGWGNMSLASYNGACCLKKKCPECVLDVLECFSPFRVQCGQALSQVSLHSLFNIYYIFREVCMSVGLVIMDSQTIRPIRLKLYVMAWKFPETMWCVLLVIFYLKRKAWKSWLFRTGESFIFRKWLCPK